MCPDRTREGKGKQVKRARIGCCRDCKSRSVEPNCHGYCPTYLAERMRVDAENAEVKARASVRNGLNDQRYSSIKRVTKSKL